MSLQSSHDQTFTVHISPFKDPSEGFVVIVEDITEKKQMEEQLQQTAKLASIGRLTAGMSHEICNPLASISSLVQELRALPFESTEDVSFTIQSLNAINGHIERIARIVRSFGDFARISPGGKGPLQHRGGPRPHRSSREVRQALEKRELRHGHRRHPRGPRQPGPDAAGLSQPYAQCHRRDVRRGRGLGLPEEGDDSVDISLADTGCGIDESLLPRVFDPFFTTKPLGKGTGLGLSICYGIIREHDGTISVKSRKNEGTTFVIRLPIAT
ncbi:MAG: ATP-binding protein [Desulfobacterales bacterium]|nr:ATP-binding protein [Desulfobacterales bacterium]